MKNNRVARILLALVLVLSCFSFGCASLRHASYKENYIHQQMDSYAYQTNINNLWSSARTLLFHHGYRVRGPGNGYQMETDWGYTDTDDTFRRYLVTAYQNNDGTNAIHFDYFEETRHEGQPLYTTSGRDYAMEYELLRMVDSQGWAAVESAAEAYADQKMASEK
ncbi:MAG: hypothetical protein J6A01_09705 [Proteobacteria bacterium]|nr:hypothetical protein [Pseudomonadota bacterium]